MYRHTRKELESLDRCILAGLWRKRPQAVSQIWRRLAKLGRVPNDTAGYQVVLRRVTRLRREGKIRPEWLAKHYRPRASRNYRPNSGRFGSPERIALDARLRAEWEKMWAKSSGGTDVIRTS